MGTIIGIGGGRYSDNEVQPIFEKIVSLCPKKEPRVLFVPTAGHDDINGDEHIFRLFIGLGCSISALLLTDSSLTFADIEEKIMSSDIIYVGGGNLEFLMNTWKKTGADKLMRRAFESGIILSGYSSGMMCWFNEGYDDCGEGGSFVFIDCLGMLPYSSCPHFEGGNWGSYEKKLHGRKYSGIAAENGAAIFFTDSGCSVMHGNDGGSVYLINSVTGEKAELVGENFKL